MKRKDKYEYQICWIDRCWCCPSEYWTVINTPYISVFNIRKGAKAESLPANWEIVPNVTDP